MSIARPPRGPSRSWHHMVTHVELGGAFQAQHLEYPMEQATVFEGGSPAGDAAAALAAGRFDVGPVIDSGVIVGIVTREAVSGVAATTPVAEVLTPLTGAMLVSADTPIGDLFGWLSERPFLFVLDGHDITGFVTVADLNKQPARAYLYLVLAGLEVALADLVRWRYGYDQDHLLELLGERDRGAVKSRVGSDRDAGADADLVSYMGFKQLLQVFEKDQALRAELGQSSGRVWRSLTWPLSELRNDVMHPVSSFVGSAEDVAELSGSVAAARDLVDAAVAALRLRHEVPLEHG